MKLPMSWLNEYVKTDLSPKELADKLLNIGLEVEDIIYMGENINNVVVGKILDIKKHFAADKLQVCLVDVKTEIVTIVTSATNIKVGDHVPVALDGADLPSGNHIVTSDLRGVTSYGMFCSGSELNIDDTVIEGAEVHGILILPESSEIGADIKDILGLNEYVLDVSITANRPDCQSIYGLAREIGAILGKKVKAPSFAYKTVEATREMPQATIADLNACSLYTGRMITDIKIKQSPKWMRDRLRYVGIRPINNIVDITNYVLMEMGQPLHAFDIEFIDEYIHVRHAVHDEKIVALDGNEYKLNENMLVIADKTKALAIAGVMGGEYSGINDNTKTVFLEAARFAKDSIRGTSRALGLRSDSSARYEKGVDYQSVETGRERALHLFYELKAGKITDAHTEAGIKQPKQKIIKTTVSAINALLGIEVKPKIMTKILTSLEFEVEIVDDNITCKVPLFREDIDNFTDLAEEIIRYYGYDNLKSTFLLTAHPTIGGLTIRQKQLEEIKDLFVSLGCYESMTFSFINMKQYDMLNIANDDKLRQCIKILNPLSEEFAVMRTQLIGSMLMNVYNNLNKKNDNFRLFEIAKTYIPKSLPLEELPTENETLSVAYVGKNENFYNIKFAVEKLMHKYEIKYELKRSNKVFMHPGISADIYVGDTCIGYFGKIHPLVQENYSINQNTFVCEINLEYIVGKNLAPIKYQPLPKFPVVDRDLAVVVKADYTIGQLEKCILKAGGDWVTDVELFDIYMGEQIEKGYKSVAFSIKIMPKDKTLVDSEIQAIMTNIFDALKEEFDAQVRQ